MHVVKGGGGVINFAILLFDHLYNCHFVRACVRAFVLICIYETVKQIGNTTRLTYTCSYERFSHFKQFIWD